MAEVSDGKQTAYEERLLATAIRRLVRKEKVSLAAALLECQLQIEQENSEWGLDYFLAIVRAPEQVYDILVDSDATEVLSSALKDLSPHNESWRHVVEIEIERVEAGWRDASYAALGLSARNQGNFMFEGKHIHNGLKYKSFSEIVIAKELDRRNILFFPLPSASRNGIVREPDFLVISKGRAGILEVHGAPYHPATRAADDHRRNSFFEESGIRTFVYDAEDVRENVKLVVDKFMSILLGALR